MLYIQHYLKIIAYFLCLDRNIVSHKNPIVGRVLKSPSSQCHCCQTELSTPRPSQMDICHLFLKMCDGWSSAHSLGHMFLLTNLKVREFSSF